MSKGIIIFSVILVIGAIVMLYSTRKNQADQDKMDLSSATKKQESKDVKNVKSMITNGDYQTNSEVSKIQWTGSAVGKAHTGHVLVKSGMIVFVDGAPQKGSLIIDMTSIADNDLSGDMQSKLVSHLKSVDFFEVEKYPESQLVITESEKTDKEGVYHLTGSLTIKGITNNIEFDATISERSNEEITMSSRFDIDRTLWNVQYGSKKFIDRIGDQLVNDMISFDVNLIGNIAKNN